MSSDGSSASAVQQIDLLTNSPDAAKDKPSICLTFDFDITDKKGDTINFWKAEGSNA
jgi:hypothetical protein